MNRLVVLVTCVAVGMCGSAVWGQMRVDSAKKSFSDFFRLSTINTTAATGTDCDDASETGRVYWDSTNDALEICSGASGWSTITFTGGTLTSALLFSADNSHDIGASGATRPRTGYFGTSVQAVNQALSQSTVLGGSLTGLRIQSATTNARSLIGLVPNGTSTLADLWLFNSSDPQTNYGRFGIGYIGTFTDWAFFTDKAGSGTAAEMTLQAFSGSNNGSSALTQLILEQGTPAAPGDVQIGGDVEVRLGTTARSVSIYGTASTGFADPTDYERLSIGHDGTNAFIKGEEGGTGDDNWNVVITPVGTGSVYMKEEVSLDGGKFIRFNGASDNSWRIGYDVATLTGEELTSNTLQIFHAGSANNGLQIGAGTTPVVEVGVNDGGTDFITYFHTPLLFSTDNQEDIGASGATRPRSIYYGTLLHHGVTAGITASTTQTQGQGALTRAINEVATVANTNDTVTLPTAVAGAEVTVVNNGANTLQIFPASGDDLGSGVDTATTLASGSNVTYVAYDATNWETR